MPRRYRIQWQMSSRSQGKRLSSRSQVQLRHSNISRLQGFRLVWSHKANPAFSDQRSNGLGWLRYLHTSSIEGEFGIGKPDKRVFLHSLKQLGVEPGDAWMVGDHLTNDVEGAQNAGLVGIWVDWRGDGLPDSTSVQPDRIVNAISESMESV